MTPTQFETLVREHCAAIGLVSLSITTTPDSPAGCNLWITDILIECVDKKAGWKLMLILIRRLEIMTKQEIRGGFYYRDIGYEEIPADQAFIQLDDFFLDGVSTFGHFSRNRAVRTMRPSAAERPYILETLASLQDAIVAENSAEIDRLLDQPIADISYVSESAETLRDLLIGDADDIHGIVIDLWERSPYKTTSECSCRIYEVFAIDDDLPIAGKAIPTFWPILTNPNEARTEGVTLDCATLSAWVCQEFLSEDTNMIIDTETAGKWQRLIQAGHTHVASHDEYSIVIETAGLSNEGKAVRFRVVVAREELRMILLGSKP